MISLKFTAPTADGAVTDSAADVFVRIEADLELIEDGIDLAYIESMPIVELAAALKGWIADGMSVGADFIFDSVSAAEPGLLEVRRTSAGWSCSSTEQHLPARTILNDAEVRALVSQFTDEVEAAVRFSLGLDVGPHIHH